MSERPNTTTSQIYGSINAFERVHGGASEGSYKRCQFKRLSTGTSISKQPSRLPRLSSSKPNSPKQPKPGGHQLPGIPSITFFGQWESGIVDENDRHDDDDDDIMLLKSCAQAETRTRHQHLQPPGHTSARADTQGSMMLAPTPVYRARAESLESGITRLQT
eukprot:scaffold663786_cov38-Prasinocladus_malaysianus.AAC.1